MQPAQQALRVTDRDRHGRFAASRWQSWAAA